MSGHSAEKDAARHMPCDMGCQPDWHHDDCAIYLPAVERDAGAACGVTFQHDLHGYLDDDGRTRVCDGGRP